MQKSMAQRNQLNTMDGKTPFNDFRKRNKDIIELQCLKSYSRLHFTVELIMKEVGKVSDDEAVPLLKTKPPPPPPGHTLLPMHTKKTTATALLSALQNWKENFWNVQNMH